MLQVRSHALMLITPSLFALPCLAKNRQRMGGEMAVDQYKPHRHHYRRGCPMSSPLIPQMFSLPNIYSSLLFFFFCIFDIFVSHFRVYIFYPITFLCFMIMIMHIDEHLI
jgi:hypothetical protein